MDEGREGTAPKDSSVHRWHRASTLAAALAVSLILPLGTAAVYSLRHATVAPLAITAKALLIIGLSGIILAIFIAVPLALMWEDKTF